MFRNDNIFKIFQSLYWEECRENFPIAFIKFLQDSPDEYDWAFEVKLKELSYKYA